MSLLQSDGSCPAPEVGSLDIDQIINLILTKLLSEEAHLLGKVGWNTKAAYGEDDDLGDDEELYQQAVDVLKSTRRASTSMLQRRLRIGYNRATRIMEIMEEKGIVGPETGSSPREILVDIDTL